MGKICVSVQGLGFKKSTQTKVNLPENHVHPHFVYFAVELLKQLSQMGVTLDKDCLLCLGALRLVFGPAFGKCSNPCGDYKREKRNGDAQICILMCEYSLIYLKKNIKGQL